MIYRRCSCGKDRAVNKASCSCGSKSTKAFKAAVVLPGTGGRRRSRTCPTLSEAQAAELALKAEMPAVKSRLATLEPETVAEAIQNAVSAPTFDELWEQYHAYSKLRKRSWKADLCRYNHHLKGPLGSKRVDTIKAADIQTIVDGCMLRKGLAPATAVQVFALIRVILSHADRFELTPEGMPNPCRRVQLPRFDNRAENPLTAEDFRKLEETCRVWGNQHAARVVLFCAYTGRRVGEVLKLEWTDIDLERALVTFRAATTKSGKVQVVPVNERALEVLQAAQAQLCAAEDARSSALVFPCSTGKYFSGFNAIWYRIRKRAKLSRHYRLHDLRHGFASTLVSNGVSLYMVKELLGHADIKTTERYAHLATGALREAAGVMCGDLEVV